MAGWCSSNDEELAAKARSPARARQDATYTYQYVGFCSRLDAMQAAMLRVKLKKLGGWNETRRANARYYIETLSDLPIHLPVPKPENSHVYHQFTVRVANRDTFAAKLAEKGVESKVFYPNPLHLERAYLHLRLQTGRFPRDGANMQGSAELARVRRNSAPKRGR